MKCMKTDNKGIDGIKMTEIEEPGKPGAGEVVVGVKAVSLNFRDLLVAKGMYGGDTGEPIIAGSDMAGEVVAVGEGVEEFKKGDRVLNAPFRFWPAGKLRKEWVKTFVGGAGVDGVLAERITYPASALVRLPDYLDYAGGSTFTIAGLTAWSGLVVHGEAKAGEWLLLHGTGGVSIFGAQIASLIGARAVMTTSSEQKGRYVKEHYGIVETVDYRDEDWPSQVKKITGGGVDVVLDVAGGASLANSISALAMNGRLSLIGVLSGMESNIKAFDLVRKQLKIRGIYMESAEKLRELVAAFEAGGISPRVDRVFPFDETRSAYEYLESQKHIGKVVIEVAQ